MLWNALVEEAYVALLPVLCKVSSTAFSFLGDIFLLSLPTNCDNRCVLLFLLRWCLHDGSSVPIDVHSDASASVVMSLLLRNNDTSEKLFLFPLPLA